MIRSTITRLRALCCLAACGATALAADTSPVLAALQKIDPDIKAEHYEAKQVDLDDDATDDALVLMNGTSSYCGSGGCTLFVLRSVDGSLTKVGAVRVVRAPIHLRKDSHHGMRDLLVHASGGGTTAHHAALAFDGTSYPLSPGDEAAKVMDTDRIIFADPDPAKKEAEMPDGPPAPARLNLEDLAGMEELSPSRRKLVALALQVGHDYHLNQYIYGSADPKRGGFDCSGAMFYLLQGSGLKPPRTSANQYDWIQDAGVLTTVPSTVTDLDDKVFSKLQPGDLLFWSSTYKPSDGRTNGVTHVQMYLGKEKKDGRQVMVGSTDGRSYRGQRQCGYGVFDFRLPRAGSKSHFAGFGPPPGLEQAASEPATDDAPKK